jgi:WD40 repeat protein
MSGFGGGGGRGGRSGGRGGRGRGRNSGGFGGGGGRSYGGGGGRGGADGDHGQQPRLKPCRDFTSGGSCPHGANCKFSHAVKLHVSLEASNRVQPQTQQHHRYNNGHNQTKFAPVSSVAIWESQPGGGPIKIFSGSHDGYWRLWNTAANFAKEFEHCMMTGGKVETLEVASNYLFCGFEGTANVLPGAKVGMIHVWNLANPADPPLELHMDGQHAPYAHAGSVGAFATVGDMMVSGGHCGVIRTWQFDQAASGGKGGFVLRKTLHGHAAEITGLVIVGGNMLWSSSTDQSIRLWDLQSGQCKYLITGATPGTVGGNPVPPSPAGQQGPAGVGHTAAVTDLVLFESPQGTFVLSSSLDGTVKAWNATDGQCMFSESHGQGIVSMALSADTQNNPLLLVGLESGDIMIRSILQSPSGNTPAFCLLVKLSNKYTKSHDGAVRAIRAGPSNTFYSAGDDGKVNVWQIAADLVQ